MRYWWVNHNKTARQEVHGGYLWSPVKEATGARSQFYDNMRIAAPGDLVLSYSGGLIRYAGQILDFASITPKPVSFGAAGKQWDNTGWLLPVGWTALTKPSRPSDRIRELSPYLPAKYSPINHESGKGNQKAYLAEISQQIFNILTELNELNLSATPPTDFNCPRISAIEDALESQIADDPGLDTTSKQQLLQARIGQGLFRARVQDYEKACRLTNIQNPRLLIASHIKPWRVCVTATERLDGANGLLLAPHVDYLFDRGFISFENDGEVLLSPRLGPDDLKRLGLQEACEKGTLPFCARQAIYLDFHRERIFLRSPPPR